MMGSTLRAALIGVALLGAAGFGPPGAHLALFLLPLPLLLVAGSEPAPAWAGAVLVTAAGASVLGGPAAAAAYLLLVALPAAGAVAAIRAGMGVERVVAAAVGVTAAAALLAFAAGGGDGKAVADALHASWDRSFDSVLEMYRAGGVAAGAIADLEARRDEIASVLLPLVPGMTCVALAAVWIVNLRLAARWVLIPQCIGWRRWAAPPWVIWVFIASGFALFVPVRAVAAVAGNVFVVTLGLYFAQGLAVVAYWLHRFRLPRVLRWLTYGIVAVQQVAAVGVLAIGVFDFWGNFRRLGGSVEGGGQS